MTKHEILNETESGKNIFAITRSDALYAMDKYAAQEVEKAKGGTCKWQHYTNDDFPECLPIGVPFIHSNSIELIYCPLCGKKIERV